MLPSVVSASKSGALSPIVRAISVLTSKVREEFRSLSSHSRSSGRPNARQGSAAGLAVRLGRRRGGQLLELPGRVRQAGRRRLLGGVLLELAGRVRQPRGR